MRYTGGQRHSHCVFISALSVKHLTYEESIFYHKLGYKVVSCLAIKRRPVVIIKLITCGWINLITPNKRMFKYMFSSYSYLFIVLICMEDSLDTEPAGHRNSCKERVIDPMKNISSTEMRMRRTYTTEEQHTASG